MSFHDYHFITHWRVRGPIEKIYQVLKDGGGYSRWWRPPYRRSEEIGPNKFRSVVRARLPYTLTFTTELERENPPHEIAIRASGDLVGTGLWRLRQDGEETEITFLWDVRAEKKMIRRLSPVLRPLFRWNHDWVMRAGERGIQEAVSGEAGFAP